MKPCFRKRLFAWILRKGDSFNHALYGQYKKELFKDIHGQVVEIGPGSGINFMYLSSEIKWIGIEPNEAFHDALESIAKTNHILATLLAGDAESIPLPDEYADVVLCTLVLCSVPDPARAIAEMKRVLKTHGRLIFIEHVAAPERTILRAAQYFLNPLNRFMADGCNCNRETWVYLEQAGFRQVSLLHFQMRGALKLHAPHISGYAIK